MPDPNKPNVNYNQPGSGEGQIGEIKGKVKIDKPSLSKRVIGWLFSDQIDSIANYLGSYILGPSLKDLIFKMGVGALQMSLFGGTNGMVNPNNTGSYIPGYGYQTVRRDPFPYQNMYQQPMGYGYAQPQATPQPAYPQFMSINAVSFDSKDDANVVLDRMRNVLRQYGRVRVADFYLSAGITGQEGNWTLQGNGWYNLDQAMPIMRTDGRWMIQFPPVQQLS